VRTVKLIPIEKCIVPDIRITAVYDAELQQMLHDSLDVMGQVVPIVVVESDSWYYVADGKHRLEEAKGRGDKTILAAIRPGLPEDVLLLNLVTNRTRGKVKASELVTVIQSLNVDHKLDSDQIAAKTGITRDTIEKYLFVAKGSPELREALDAEIIGVGHAYEVARLPRHEQQAEVLAKYQVWKWSVQALRDQVSSVLALMDPPVQDPAPPPPPRAPVKPRCDICKTEHEPRDLRPTMCCPECFGLAWKAKHDGGSPT
jgi:ParB/RepB/Spo0J family partition protein